MISLSRRFFQACFKMFSVSNMYYLNFKMAAKFYAWQTQVNPYKLSTLIVTGMTVDKSRCTVYSPFRSVEK